MLTTINPSQGVARMNPKKNFSLVALLSAASIYADVNVTPTIVARSQGRNAVRKLTGLTDKVHKYEKGFNVNIAGQVEFDQTFRANAIANSLFGADYSGCEIKIQGSQVADRDAKAWLADYFYLAPDYNSSFSITPKIQNALVDLDLYWGLDNIYEGLYVRLSGPITWTKWNLNFDEPCDIVTTGSYNAGYFDANVMFNNQLNQNFGDYAQGCSPLNTNEISNLNSSAASYNIGVQFDGLQFAKIERCARTATGFAELRMELGYDFLETEKCHLGANFQLAAPTGGRRKATFAFDSVVGNGNHWEVGGGITGHYTFWKSQDETKKAGLYIDLSLTHINNAREQRTFDLCNRPNSRYMLAEKMAPVLYIDAATGNGGTSLVAGPNNVLPVAQFDYLFTPVANLTSLNVNVRSNIQADLALMFNYTSNNWGLDIGYNYWARSAEKITTPDSSMPQCCPSLCGTSDKNQWALKGDARVFGFNATTDADLPENSPAALSATQCGATIHQGTNAGFEDTSCTGASVNQNCGVDNAATAGLKANLLIYELKFSTQVNASAGNLIKTSLQPLFINCCDINFQQTKGSSNKIFAALNYTWDNPVWVPYVGVGGSAEFGSNVNCNDSCDGVIAPDCSESCDDTSCCNQCCTDPINVAVSQWAIWLKAGVSFN
jgi:hypothetical protein